MRASGPSRVEQLAPAGIGRRKKSTTDVVDRLDIPVESEVRLAENDALAVASREAFEAKAGVPADALLELVSN